MDDQQLKLFKQQLLTLSSELLACEASAKESSSTVILDQSRVGRLSRMDALQSQQMAIETARRRQLQLKKIEAALRRIEHDEFGLCFNCADEIDIRRLTADPTTTRCMDCINLEASK